jgi:3,4-dihydroxy-2-butanone 4-phosphate synthase
MVRHTSGYVCASLTEAYCERFDLPPRHHTNQGKQSMAYVVTVDAQEGVSTGISAADRAHTIRLLADPAAKALDFTRPGYVVPLRAKEGDVLRRPGHTEAAVDLAWMAGLTPVGVLCEIVSAKDDRDMARREELEHEGRGLGLLHKLQTYQLQDAGADTVDANLALSIPADARDYGTGAQILMDLGVDMTRLLTNNPAKRAGLEDYGLQIIGRVGLPVRTSPENLRYVRTKRDRMGHDLADLDGVAAPAPPALVVSRGMAPLSVPVPELPWASRKRRLVR